MKKHLVWFRSDLRTSDNPALHRAFDSADQAIAVYLRTPGQDREHHRGERQLGFIDANLDMLSTKLARQKIDLHILQCDRFDDCAETLQEFIKAQEINWLFANWEPGINEARRDRAVADSIGIPFSMSNGDCVLEPGSVLNNQGDMFRVFTPFCKAWLRRLAEQGYACEPDIIDEQPDQPSAESKETDHCPPGEAAAQATLRHFIEQALQDYAAQRDFPAIEGTSRISPYLALGVLSPRQCLQAIETELGYLPMSRGENGFAWLNELVWREFYRHLMQAYPRISMDRSFQPQMDDLCWSDDEQLFDAWCAGMTGYPIVDAAMRCLIRTGWMHNRLRMIVASFLTKDLQIDWRRGEQYFMQQLLDADFASNNGGWQWAAGTGADAAPYFRIFNPTTQSQKFDPEGDFIRRWVAELADVPAKHIHQPQAWLDNNHAQQPYPSPIVDHAVARKQTLERYQRVKEAYS